MFSKSRTCCGVVPIETGVVVITIIGILNKLSGFYGVISFDLSDPVAFALYIYSLLAVAAFAQGLYGICKENIRIVRWYTMFYWVDCLISLVTTILFAVRWFVYTDHSLPELANDPVKQQEHDQSFQMEGFVSIALLAILRLVHFYFAIVLTYFYKTLGKARYSKLAASVDQDLEDIHYDMSQRQQRF
ncbi:hypothetical protein VTP01DRAFT_510 [Rhizomucor pusillus]|uniref:uncharacterized protein n=1 Tax=Rhizomucor pusillus TaxID=4840 RepID=UPI00374325CF